MIRGCPTFRGAKCGVSGLIPKGLKLQGEVAGAGRVVGHCGRRGKSGSLLPRFLTASGKSSRGAGIGYTLPNSCTIGCDPFMAIIAMREESACEA